MESAQKGNDHVPKLNGQEKKKYIETRLWRYSFSFEQLEDLYWIICGLMNGKGGTIAIGVDEKGEEQGITLTSSNKDELEREMSYSIDNVVPRITRISVLNFVSTSFREIPWPNRPLNVKKYIIEINVNPGNPARYYTRLISPMNKINIYIRTAAQIRGYEIEVGNTKRNQNQADLIFEPEIKDLPYSQKHLELNKVKSRKKYTDIRMPKNVDPRCLGKNVQINDLAARIQKKNEYINELISSFIQARPDNLGQNLEDLDAVAAMLNHMEEIAIQTYNDFYKRVFDREVKDVRYTH